MVQRNCFGGLCPGEYVHGGMSESRTCCGSMLARFTANILHLRALVKCRMTSLLLQAPTVLRPLEDVHVAEGSDALLTCCVCGRPTPTFEWSSAGRRVDSGRVVHDQLTGNLRLEVSRHIGLYTALIYVSLLKIF